MSKNYCSASPATTKLFIDGKAVESQTTRWIDLHNPATNEVITRVPISTQDEMEQAVSSSKQVSVIIRGFFRIFQKKRRTLNDTPCSSNKKQG